MDNKSLLLTHIAHNEHPSSFSFIFPEPKPDKQVLVIKGGNNGQGWETNTIAATGIGRYVSYRTYDIKETTKFTSEVSEPVICLAYRYGAGCSIAFSAEHPSYPIDREKNFLFWQGDGTVEQEVQVGKHAHFDFFVRPECLVHLNNRPIIKELIEQSFLYPRGNIGQLDIAFSQRFERLMFDIIEELDKNTPTAERFSYLCDCLLLTAIGENITPTPPPKKVTPDTPKGPISYSPKPREQQMLNALANMNRDVLLMKYRHQYKTTTEKEKQRDMEIELDITVKNHSMKLWAMEKEILAGLYFHIAELFALEYENELMTADDRALLKKAVVKTCDLSFELHPPSISKLDFYGRWSEKVSMFQQIGDKSVQDFLSALLPDNTLSFTKRKDQRGKNLLIEQVREAFGIRPMSYFTGETPEDKPKEIVQLHTRLMEHCVDTLELDNEDGVTRSDIVRELDSAYQLNDLIALLQIEIEQLCPQDGYLEQQDDERLKWLIVALQHTEQDCDEFFKEIVTSTDYYHLRLFHSLGNNMREFKKAVRKDVAYVQQKGLKLADSMKKVIANPIRSEILELAEVLTYEWT
ncbi:MAG: hypothetical protein LBF27_30870 [Sphingobacterium sp.]|jgi:hypothetical protein|nr:hypothetical protein [Sphingobacterium sp.]